MHRAIYPCLVLAAALVPILAACASEQQQQPAQQPQGYPQTYPTATYGNTGTTQPTQTATAQPTLNLPAMIPTAMLSNLPAMIPSGMIPGWPAPTASQ